MTGNESAGLEDSKSHTTCPLSSLAADTGTPAGKESRARGGSWVTGTHPPGGPRAHPCWQALFWKWPLLRLRTAPWYISPPSKTPTSGSGTSDDRFHADPCWPGLQAQNPQALGWERGGEGWLTGTAGTALTLRERKTAGAERGQERAGSKVRVRVEAGGWEEAVPLIFQAAHSWSYLAWSGTENILGSLILLPPGRLGEGAEGQHRGVGTSEVPQPQCFRNKNKCHIF